MVYYSTFSKDVWAINDKEIKKCLKDTKSRKNTKSIQYCAPSNAVIIHVSTSQKKIFLRPGRLVITDKVIPNVISFCMKYPNMELDLKVEVLADLRLWDHVIDTYNKLFDSEE